MRCSGGCRRRSDRAVAELAGTQFDIPDEIRTLECLIAPTQEGGIYYTGPSDDFSRPGRMWWSVPEGVTEFDTWRELTTVYHEGVPGHHLQIGQAVVQPCDSSTRGGGCSPAPPVTPRAGRCTPSGSWSSSATSTTPPTGSACSTVSACAPPASCSTSACTSASRAPTARAWDADYALDFIARNVNMPDGFVQFEVNRYLGWPGQAPSYKVGQRIWEQIRDESRRREGDAFDIREFHKRALDLGGVGLDTLRELAARLISLRQARPVRGVAARSFGRRPSGVEPARGSRW